MRILIISYGLSTIWKGSDNVEGQEIDNTHTQKQRTGKRI